MLRFFQQPLSVKSNWSTIQLLVNVKNHTESVNRWITIQLLVRPCLWCQHNHYRYIPTHPDKMSKQTCPTKITNHRKNRGLEECSIGCLTLCRSRSLVTMNRISNWTEMLDSVQKAAIFFGNTRAMIEYASSVDWLKTPVCQKYHIETYIMQLVGGRSKSTSIYALKGSIFWFLLCRKLRMIFSRWRDSVTFWLLRFLFSIVTTCHLWATLEKWSSFLNGTQHGAATASTHQW